MSNGDREKGPAWLRAQVASYRSVYPHFQRYAEVLQAILQKAGADLAPLAIIQSRPKSIASFAEKTWRKRGKYADPIHQLTDLCGTRVICRTRSEVEAMSGFIKDTLNIDWANSLDCSQRLAPTEFGYRSVHYIVSFPVSAGEVYDIPIPEEVVSKPAEIQVRTVVEHAYADFVHDLSYKGAFRVPTSWVRELAGVAAALEEADQAFSRIEERLSLYATNYGAYLNEEQIREEIETLDVILEFDSENAEKAVRLAKLAHHGEDWGKAEAALKPFVDPECPEASPQPALRELGITYCKKYAPGSEEYDAGQEYLEIASAPEFADVDALCSLAGTWKGKDEAKARNYYRKAFEIDPYDPYALGNFLEYELPENPGFLGVARPLMRQAVDRCQAQSDAGVNMPWAFYDIGKFLLLLGDPIGSLDAYAKALSVTSAPFMVETSLASVRRLESVADQLPGFEWVRRLLALGLATRFPSEARLEAVRDLVSPGDYAVEPPVLIVAGGTDPRIEEEIRGYSGLLRAVMAGFSGTVISGGTVDGISGLVADTAESFPDQVYTIGYLPAPTHDSRHERTGPARYSEIRHTQGSEFTPLEPLQSWIDLLASGVQPGRVRVLGINGGDIAGTEYRIALALGARVGLVTGSGREVGRILSDPFWSRSAGLVALPDDPAVAQAFTCWEPPQGSSVFRDSIAPAIHEEYRRERMSTRQVNDPALADWDSLRPDLKESNRDQAGHLLTKLEAIGCTCEEAEGGTVASGEFTDAEVEILAQMEHGRWVVERLLSGWEPGEDRDPTGKRSPYLVAWSELSEEARELDRQTVRKIPHFLDAVGYRVRRVS